MVSINCVNIQIQNLTRVLGAQIEYRLMRETSKECDTELSTHI